MPESIGGLLHPGNMVRGGQPFAGGKRGLPSRLSFPRARPCGPVMALCRSRGLLPFLSRFAGGGRGVPCHQRARPGWPPAVAACIQGAFHGPSAADRRWAGACRPELYDSFQRTGRFRRRPLSGGGCLPHLPLFIRKSTLGKEEGEGEAFARGQRPDAAAGRIRCDDGSCGHRQQGGGLSPPPGQAAESVSTPRRAAARTGGCRPAACVRPGRPVP